VSAEKKSERRKAKLTDKSQPNSRPFPGGRETLVDGCAAAHSHLDGRRHERLVAEALGRRVVTGRDSSAAGCVTGVVHTSPHVRYSYEPHHRAALRLLDEIRPRVKTACKCRPSTHRRLRIVDLFLFNLFLKHKLRSSHMLLYNIFAARCTTHTQ